MAQPPRFISYGGMQVKKSVEYDSADLPTVPAQAPAIDTVKLSEAPRIWRKVMLEDGTQKKIKGIPQWTQTNRRGVYVLIKRSGVAYVPEHANVPVLYIEGEEIVVDAADTYTFMQDCVIEYGATAV